MVPRPAPSLPDAEARLDENRRKLGDDHPNTWKAMFDLARAYVEMGDNHSAGPILETVVPALQRILGAADPDTIWAMSIYGSVLMRLGQPDLAVALSRDTLLVLVRQYGDNDFRTVRALSNLVIGLKELGEHEEVGQLQERIVAALRRLHRADHPETMDALSQLARTKYLLGDWRAVVDVERQVVAGRTRTLGKDAHSTLDSKQNLADALAHAQPWGETGAEALAIVDDVVLARTVGFGETDRKTLFSVLMKVDILLKIGRADEAAALSRPVLEMHDRVLGREDPQTIEALLRYVQALEMSGQGAEELPQLADRLVRSRQKLLGETHPDTFFAAGLLAIAYSNLDKLDEERAVLEAWSARSQEALGEGHPSTLQLLQPLVLVLLELGENDSAKELMSRILDAARPSWAEDTLESIRSEATCAQLLASAGDVRQARRLARHAAKRAVEALGPDHPVTRWTLGALEALS